MKNKIKTIKKDNLELCGIRTCGSTLYSIWEVGDEEPIKNFWGKDYPKGQLRKTALKEFNRLVNQLNKKQ